MARYIEYIPSIYSWLGDIPSHWEEKSIRQITKVSSERLENRNLPLLSVYREYGVIPKKSRDDNHNVESSDLSNYKVVYKDNLVLNKMKMWQGSLGVSKYNGIVSPAYIVCKIVDESLNVRFLHFLLRTAKYKTYYNQYSYGIRVGQWDMHYEDLKNMKVYIPPLTEQEQIVRFLDWKVSEINKLIGIERGKIQNLEELKNKAIDKAVIHGLKPQKEKLNEDIRWEISYPSSWKIERLRNIFSFRKGLSITKANLEPNGIEVINYGQIHSKKNTMVSLNEDLFKYVNESYLETDAASLVKKGDFIFADTSEDLEGCGNCAYIDRCGEIFAGYHTVIAHPKERTNNKYFAYLFKSSVWRYQVRKKVNAVKVYSITQQILKDVFLFVPSELEQVQIVEHLDKLCYQIDEFISTAKKKINELEDMKAVVISDVVTGKIDVRNVEIPEYEHIDDMVDDGDWEENEEELADAEETEA